MKKIILKTLSICLIFICIFSFCSCKKENKDELAETEPCSEIVSENNQLLNIPIITMYTEKSEETYDLIITCTVNNVEEWKFIEKNALTNETSLSYSFIAQTENLCVFWVNGKLLALDMQGKELWKTSSMVLKPAAGVCNEDYLYLIYAEDPITLSKYDVKTGDFKEAKELNLMDIFTAPLSAIMNDDKIIIQDMYKNLYEINLNTYDVTAVIDESPKSFVINKNVDDTTIISEDVDKNKITQYKIGSYEVSTIISLPNSSVFEGVSLEDFTKESPVVISNYSFERLTNTTESAGQIYKVVFLTLNAENYSYSLIINCLASDFSEESFTDIINSITLQ